MQPIKVNRQFLADFEVVTRFYKMPAGEIDDLKVMARKNYKAVSASLEMIASEIRSGAARLFGGAADQIAFECRDCGWQGVAKATESIRCPGDVECIPVDQMYGGKGVRIETIRGDAFARKSKTDKENG